MGYVLTVAVTMVLLLTETVFTAVRSTLQAGGDQTLYTLLAVHEVLVVAIGVTVFAFFSNTVWFTAGLLPQLVFSIKATVPLWVLRLFFVAMPDVYLRVLSGGRRGWDDGVYIFLAVLAVLSSMALSASVMYTAACLSDKRMYAPYHKEMEEEALRQRTEADRELTRQQHAWLGPNGTIVHRQPTSDAQALPGGGGTESVYPGYNFSPGGVQEWDAPSFTVAESAIVQVSDTQIGPTPQRSLQSSLRGPVLSTRDHNQSAPLR